MALVNNYYYYLCSHEACKQTTNGFISFIPFFLSLSLFMRCLLCITRNVVCEELKKGRKRLTTHWVSCIKRKKEKEETEESLKQKH